MAKEIVKATVPENHLLTSLFQKKTEINVPFPKKIGVMRMFLKFYFNIYCV